MRVNERFGGDRSQLSGRNVLALTQEGQQEMMRRFPLKQHMDEPSSVPSKKIDEKKINLASEENPPIIHPPSKQARASSQLSGFMHGLVRGESLSEIPDANLQEAGAVEHHIKSHEKTMNRG